ncbi:MAG: DNA replication and repair protein RecF [Thermaerobacter sp.]|nr:DNA replication and repair protein RecF [Thermaerobacter sp.]
MIIEHLELRNWRNAVSVSVDFPPGLTLVTGQNAQGKTNLLEAVFFLATGRSHRTSHPEELVSFAKDQALLRAVIQRKSGTFTLSAQFAGGRVTRLRDGKAFRRGQDPLGDFSAILFAPEDLLVLKGAPAERRRILDLDLGQAAPTYRSVHARYAQVLRQRNALLRTYEQPPREMLATWDAAWAQAAVALTDLRARLVADAAPRLTRRTGEIAGGPAADLVYEPSLEGKTVAEALEQLAARAQDELRRRQSLVGPHRDDLRIEIDGRDLRLYGSQGEQRTALVAFKLAAVEMLSERPGGAPVLLLDDVLSELDQGRRRNLLLAAMGAQTIVTTTEPQLAGMVPDTTFAVRGGEYERTW